MDLFDYHQIDDHEKYQVYEKFTPYTKRDPFRGTYHLWVIGNEANCIDWIRQYERKYHPAGYGTHFEEMKDLSTTTHRVYRGSRSHSCD